MPKRPLSRDRIVAAALAQVDRHGLEGLSMRKLGEAVGVEAMSLYHFFPSKQHLVDALVDHAIGSIEFPPGSLPPLERMRRLMRAYRAMVHRHERMYWLIAMHRLNTPTGVKFIEGALTIARDITGNDETAARSFRTLGYYVVGAALDETMGYAKGPSAAEPVDDEYIRRNCPLLARSGRYFQRDQWDKTFEQGMEEMLGGLEKAARRKKKR